MSNGIFLRARFIDFQSSLTKIILVIRSSDNALIILKAGRKIFIGLYIKRMGVNALCDAYTILRDSPIINFPVCDLFYSICKFVRQSVKECVWMCV